MLRAVDSWPVALAWELLQARMIYMKICDSCGMPMESAKDHGAGNMENAYCKYCSDAKGQLKPWEMVLEGFINYMMKSEKKPREEAERMARAHLEQMPAWAKKE